MVSISLEFLGRRHNVETDDLDRGPQERAYRRSLMPHINVCLDSQTDRFSDTQSIGENYQTMAGDFVLVHGEAGRQPDVLQIMKRATQMNTRNSARIMTLNTYSETG